MPTRDPDERVTSYNYHGAVLVGTPEIVIGSEQGFRYELFAPMGDVRFVGGGYRGINLVALSNGEIWKPKFRTSRAGQPRSSSCFLVPGRDRELGPNDDGDRWCRLQRDPAPVISMSGGCWVEEGGQLKCSWLSSIEDIDLGDRRATVVSGTTHTCVLTEGGEVGCWGEGSHGEIGYVGEGPLDLGPGKEDHFSAKAPPENFLRFNSPVLQMIAPPNKTFVLLKNGELWGWGDVKGPFVGVGEQHPFQRLGSPQQGESYFYPACTRTLPAGPMQVPHGCIVESIGDGCVICKSGCLMCWDDANSLELAECHTF